MSEASERYSVLIVGIDAIEGGASEAVVRLEKRFRLPRNVAEKLVSSIPAVVKKDVTMGEAQRYASALRSIDAECRIVPFKSSASNKASVTGILRKKSKSRRGDSTSREAVRTSGGYTMVKRRRNEDEHPAEGDETHELDDVADFLGALADPDEGTPMGGVRSASGEAEAVERTIVGIGGAAQRPSPATKTARFDPSAFALPDHLGSGEHAPVSVSDGGSGDFGAIGEAPNEAPAAPEGAVADEPPAGRPSVFDELMALGPDSQLGVQARGALEASGAIAPVDAEIVTGQEPAVSPEAERPSAERIRTERPAEELATSGPSRVTEFGTLELAGADESGIGLELDTDKPHLTGRHMAVGAREGADEDEFTEPPSSLAGSGVSRAFDPDADDVRIGLASGSGDFDGVRPRSGAVRRMRDVGTPMSEPGVRRSESGPTPRVSSSNPAHVVGGFDARAERSRKSTQRTIRTFLGLILMIIVFVAGAYGVYFYLQYAASADSKRFAEASTYYEHQIRLPNGDAVRACALVGEDSPEYVCRYSREWYASHFVGLSEAVLDRAPGACFGALYEDGQTFDSTIDCLVETGSGDATEKTRLYVSTRRECDASLTAVEAGNSVSCRSGSVAEVLAQRADAPTLPLEEELEFTYRRDVQLATDVGAIDAREFMVEGGETTEYRYFAPEIGLFVRRAELAGSARLRLTYSERAGQTSGTQVWPR